LPELRAVIGEPKRMIFPSRSMRTPSCCPRQPHVRARGAPRLGDFVRVVDPDVRCATNRARVAFGHESEVDLHAVPRCDAVPSAGVIPGDEAEPLIVLERSLHVTN
jgi:hypothetical protein